MGVCGNSEVQTVSDAGHCEWRHLLLSGIRSLTRSVLQWKNPLVKQSNKIEGSSHAYQWILMMLCGDLDGWTPLL